MVKLEVRLVYKVDKGHAILQGASVKHMEGKRIISHLSEERRQELAYLMNQVVSSLKVV